MKISKHVRPTIDFLEFVDIISCRRRINGKRAALNFYQDRYLQNWKRTRFTVQNMREFLKNTVGVEEFYPIFDISRTHFTKILTESASTENERCCVSLSKIDIGCMFMKCENNHVIADTLRVCPLCDAHIPFVGYVKKTKRC